MNKELKELIDSTYFKRDAIGNKDILYKIGLFHRNLPVKERDWEELTAYLKLPMTANAYRCSIKDKLLKEGNLPVKDISGKVIDDQSDDIQTQIDNLFKERTKTRDTINSHKRMLRDEARTEQFCDNMLLAMKELPKLPKITTLKKSKANKSEAILLFSDLHIGVNCNNFYNSYNVDVAKDRLSKLVSDTIKYCKLHNVAKLNVINLGDLIHGLIHIDSRIESQLNVVEQVMTATEYLAEVLNELQAAAPVITYRSCSDNHSRMYANKNEALPEENFNKLIDWYLMERLNKTNVEFIGDSLDYGLGKFELNNGKIVMYAHGHEDSLNQVVQNWSAAIGQVPDYLCLGHLHNTKLKSFNGAKVFVNGSICGTEQYALSKRLFGKAEQTLLIFDTDNVIDYTINLQGA